MKLLATATAAVILFASCDVRRQDKVADDTLQKVQQALKDTTSVQLIDSVYNFGTITEGESVQYNYRFKNIGSKPLVISSAQPSCGCTVPEKPEKPVLPGETGFIKVTFNSKGRVGHADKEVIVMANVVPAFPNLKLTGEVKEQAPQ
ncbi:MAG: hypothetical protein RL172_870 [Bacteroidota bacterium]|jgi:hypothetical protein